MAGMQGRDLVSQGRRVQRSALGRQATDLEAAVPVTPQRLQETPPWGLYVCVASVVGVAWALQAREAWKKETWARGASQDFQ